MLRVRKEALKGGVRVDKTIDLRMPLNRDLARQLKAGDFVEISGIVYAARDAAHKKLIEMLDAGKELPFDIKDQVIYYTGPCPAKPGCVIGSAGPTTSGRMDAYTPRLIELGLSGMIGKGLRSNEVGSHEKIRCCLFRRCGRSRCVAFQVHRFRRNGSLPGTGD